MLLMSGPEGSEKPVIQKIMHLSFEDGTSDYQVEWRARLISSDLFNDPQVGEHSPIGTILLFDVSMTGIKDLKLRRELNGDEILLRNLTLQHFEGID